MKEEKAFFALIYYIIFIFFKRIFDLVVSIKYPEEENVTERGIILTRIRLLLSCITTVWILYILFAYKYNTRIYLFILLIESSTLFYFLFEKKIIYNFIDKEKIDQNIIKNIDREGGIILNIIFLIIYSFLMVKLFTK